MTQTLSSGLATAATVEPSAPKPTFAEKHPEAVPLVLGIGWTLIILGTIYFVAANVWITKQHRAGKAFR